MSRPLRVLIVEDSEDDTLLLLRELRRGGYDPVYERVETSEAMEVALAEQGWEVVIADYSLPHFNVPAALALLQTNGLDLPFIIVSGTVGEDAAVAAMKAGAHDYLMKGQLTRLVPAIEREMREAEGRRERRRGERELRKLFRAVEHSPASVVITDPAGNIEYVNPKFAEVTGYTTAEVMGQNPRFLKSGQTPAEEYRRLWETITGGGTWHGEFHNKKKNGVLYWEIASISPVFDEQGKIIHFVAVKEDITERKQAEEERRQTTAELRFANELVEQTTQPIAVGDFQGHIIRFNQAYQQLSGYSSEELLTMTYQQLTPERWYDMEAQQVAHLMATGQTVRYEKEYRRKDGTLVPIEAVIDIYRNEAGQPEHLIGFFTDITARKRMEAALAEERNLLRTLVDNLPDSIYVKDTQGRHLLVNHAAAQGVYGATREDMLGKTDLDLYPSEVARQWYADDLAVIESGQPLINQEEVSLDETGGMTWDLTTKIPLFDSQGKVMGLVGITRDITERKRYEEALRQSEEQYRGLFEHMLEGFAYCQMIFEDGEAQDFIYLAVNDMFGTLTGLKEVIGKKVTEVIPGIRESDPELLNIYGRVSLTGKPEKFEMFVGALELWFSISVYSPEPGFFVAIFDVITERKRAEIELEQRAVQLALINNISAQVTAVLELDRLLDQTAFLIHHMFNYHHVAIFFLEAGTLHLKAVAGLYSPYFPAGHTQCLDQGIMGRVATSGVKIVANDVSQEPHYISLIAAHSITRSEVCFPLIIAGQTIGVLDIQSPHLNGFGQNDVTAMEALAHQLAGAIANARLYEQAWQEINERQRVEAEISVRNRELTLLNQIIAVSSGGQDVETVLEITCVELARAFNMAQVTATLLNEEKSELVVAARYAAVETGLSEISNEDWLTTPGARMAIDRRNPLVRTLLSQSGPLVAPEAQNDPRLAAIHEALRRRGIVSVLVLPLQDEGMILGSLNLDAVEPRSFSAEEVALAWSVADQVAGALSRIRLEQERAQAEAEVRASEERFRQVVASVSDHIYLSEITAEGRHLNRYISPNVEQLTGYPMEKFTCDATFWPTVVIHPDDRAIAAGQLDRLRHGENSEVEYRLVRADGQIIWVRDNGRVMPQAGSVLIYGVVSDITERKQAEIALLEERALLARRVAERTAELSAANAQLARAAQLKDEFLANMSHELRTPLNAILGMSEILREKVFGSLNQEQLNFVGHIEEGGRHLLMLINDILDLSKIEAGKLELIVTPVLVEDVCQASLRFIKQIAQKKQINLSFALDSPISTIQADERRLKQILVNLLTNAVKFTPEGGQVKLEVVHDPANEILCFSVHDTGIGIAPEDMERLFKPFVQLDSKLSRQHEGTGLGLSLVSRLAELHGGGVRVESRPGQGSQFTVSLPYHAEVRPDEPPAQPFVLVPGSIHPLQIQRVLIVEDSPAAAEQLVHYLAEGNTEILVQATGAEAIAKALSWQPQVIILDILLPDLPGWEVLAQLKANPATQDIPVLIVSVVDERSHGLELGAAEYLVKPISRTQLWQAIGQVLSLQRTPGSEKPLILLAEDNEANINTMSPYLEAKGYRLKLARNGNQAVEMAQEERPDVILMDIQMPVMDGLEAIRRLRTHQQFTDVPIIALTALAMPGDRERCLAAGANKYLSKPVSLKGLVELIEQMTPSPSLPR